MNLINEMKNEMKNGINIYTTDEEPLHYFFFMKFCNYLEKIYDTIDYIINNHNEIYYDKDDNDYIPPSTPEVIVNEMSDNSCNDNANYNNTSTSGDSSETLRERFIAFYNNINNIVLEEHIY